ncbi:MAG: transposase [Candidatus Woesebacteria bacterium]|nr:transposase [Candidatus Woesebacteria bacterium]
MDKALEYAHKRPVHPGGSGRRPRGRNLEELIRDFPELIELGILGDGTERPVRKPKDKKARESEYSGKKKRHTKKNVLLARPDNQEVLYLSETRDGSVHDKRVIEDEGLSPGKYKKPILLGLDLGFEGLSIPGFKPMLPKKKPKGQELTEVQKSQNKTFSRIRVKVENAICGVKRSRCVFDTYRNIKVGTDDLLMSVACGLHNVRVAYRYQKA